MPLVEAPLLTAASKSSLGMAASRCHFEDWSFVIPRSESWVARDDSTIGPRPPASRSPVSSYSAAARQLVARRGVASRGRAPWPQSSKSLLEASSATALSRMSFTSSKL
jgi:hypothetical protein